MLRVKQKTFAELYAINGNASESARVAGYSHSVAHVTGSRLLKVPAIQEHIEKTRAANVLAIRDSSLERARKLSKKENYSAEVIALYDSIDDPLAGNKTKRLEMFGKVCNHFSENDSQNILNLNILNLTTEQLSERAKRLIDSLGAIKLPTISSDTLSRDIILDTTNSNKSSEKSWHNKYYRRVEIGGVGRVFVAL